MTARLVLHVGLPKCGSSYLQGVLDTITPDQGRQAGVLPIVGRPAFLAAIGVAESWSKWGRPKRAVAGRWQHIVDTVHNNSGTVVVSNELFTYVDRSQAERALRDLDGVEIDVVVVARGLTSLLPSRWQQNLKTGWTKTFDDYLDEVFGTGPKSASRRLQLDPTGPGRIWGSRLDPGRVHVVTMPPPGSPYGELWDRFAIAGGLTGLDVELPERPANPAVGVASAELLRRVNDHYVRRDDPKSYGRMVKRMLVNEVLVGDDSPRLRLPAERLEMAAALAAEICGGIEDAGYHVVGDLADLLPTAEDRPTATDTAGTAEVGREQVLDLAAAAVADLLKRQDELRGEVRRLTGELDAARTAAPADGARRSLFRR